MQLFSRNKALAALSLGALAALGACGDDVTVPVAPAAPVVISITPGSAALNVGESINFAVQISGGSTTAAPTLQGCASSNAAVATAAVQSGACRVTAVAAGNASITATASTGQSAAASVSVAAPAAAISGLAVSPTASNIGVGQSVTLVPTVNRAGAAVNVSYAFTSSNPTVATVTSGGVVSATAPGTYTITVTATGSGTGFTTTSLTTAATVTVSSLPAGITSLNVTPTAVSLAIGGTASVVANVQQPQGAAAADIIYGTTAPAVATVANGVITAVAPGSAVITVTATSAANANFAASTVSASVAVTVSPRAQVSIAAITQNNAPVNVLGTSGVIQTSLNIVTNGQVVTSAQVYTCAPNASPCPAADQAPVAQQTFGPGGSATGSIQLIVNTADFKVTSDFATATPTFYNGQNMIVATITTAGGEAIASSNQSILNITNPDGFAARHTAPTNSVVTGGLRYFGGPGATGSGEIRVVPVVYTAGRSINTAEVGVSTLADCSGTASFAATDARPWIVTYGYPSADVDCTDANSGSAAADTTIANVVSAIVSASTYNDNTNGPTASPDAAPYTAGAFAITTTSSTPVYAPAKIRVDYAAPTGQTYAMPGQNGGVDHWVGMTYDFTASTNRGDGSDVGQAGLNTATRLYEVQGCGSTTWASMATGSAADVTECATDFTGGSPTVGPYEVRFSIADNLGNVSETTTPVKFGVDKTNPVIRYTDNTTDDEEITNGTVTFEAEALEERSGLQNWQHYLAGADNTTPARSGQCIVGTTADIGAAFISAPACTMAAASSSFGATDGTSGYTVLTTVTVGSNSYYTYGALVRDRAGNTASTPARTALRDATAPAMSVVADATTKTATSVLAVNGAAVGEVEVQGTSFNLTYGTNTLWYPAVSAGQTTFDDVALAASDTIANRGLPFTFGTLMYQQIEAADDTTGAVDGVSVTGTTPALATYGFNFLGTPVGAVSANTILTTTADAAAWTTKVPDLLTFSAASNAAGFNAPAGVKARAITNDNVVNSPFTRVDFYQLVGGSNWAYLGSVDARTASCLPNNSCGVYTSDTGVAGQRAWTFVLNAPYAGSPLSLSAQTVSAGSTIVAIGSNGSGRVLLSRPAAN